jgi:hypothetical protein
MSVTASDPATKPRGRGNPENMTNAGKGRPPGVPNKIHTDVKKLAQSFGPDAIRKLAEMGGLIPDVKPATPNATQAYALDKLLDRAYGKAPQAHSLEGDGELLGVVLIPAKRPVGSRDLAPAPAPMIEGAVVRDAEVVSDAADRDQD